MAENTFTPQEAAKFKRDRRRLGGLMLRLSAAAAVPLLLGGDTAERPATVPSFPPAAPETAPIMETEPKRVGIPLIADIPPTAKHMQEPKESGLLKPETQPFDIPSFFNRLTGADYDKLQKEFQREGQYDWPLYGEEGAQYLLSKGMEREALCLSLADGWSSHGESVAQAMRNYRDQQETVIKKRTQDPQILIVTRP